MLLFIILFTFLFGSLFIALLVYIFAQLIPSFLVFYKRDAMLNFIVFSIMTFLSCLLKQYSELCLNVTEATIITTLPSTLDVTVGESIVLPCQVTHDPSLELKFTWFFNEQLIHFGNHGVYFEKVGSVSIDTFCISLD